MWTVVRDTAPTVKELLNPALPYQSWGWGQRARRHFVLWPQTGREIGVGIILLVDLVIEAA